MTYWKCIILDDENTKALQLSRAALAQYLHWASLDDVELLRFSDLLASENCHHLLDCQIACVDLKWERTLFPRGQDLPLFPTKMPIPPASLTPDIIHRDFVLPFLGVLARAKFEPAPVLENEEVAAEDFGLWLALLLRSINPSCELLFYSQNAGIADRGALAPLRRFPRSRIEFAYKSAVDSIDVHSLQKPLEHLQRRELRNAPRLRSWAVEQALNGLRTPLTPPGLKVEQNYSFEAIFPQLAPLSAVESFRGLCSLISASRPRANQRTRTAIEAAYHQLKHFLRPTTVPSTEWPNYRSDVAATVLSCADARSVLADVPDDAAGHGQIELYTRRVYAWVRDARPALKHFADDSGGSAPIGWPDFPNWRNTAALQEAREPTEPPMFDLSLLGAVIVALETNAPGALSVSDCSLAPFVLLHWEDDRGSGFQTFEEFILKLSTSFGTGIGRGLPTVLDFALAHNAVSLAVFVGNLWKELLGARPNGIPTRPVVNSFAVEWVLPATSVYHV